MTQALAALTIVAMALLATPAAKAQALSVLHGFTNSPDGIFPIDNGRLVRDSSGNLYGTTNQGGVNGIGIVFELANSSGTYTEKILYTFSGGDGGNPQAGLIIDGSGNLYGTTTSGGASGNGTVFELVNSSGTYTEKVLYSFSGGSDGANPFGGLVRDASGNLYGTTYSGGASLGGTVFELVNSSGTYTEKVLYTFTGRADGGTPQAGLLLDASGNLFGTTLGGGASGNGTVFELVNSLGTYTEKVLYSFSGLGDGAYPVADLIMDASGNLYGTTSGSFGFNPSGNGTAFELVNSSGTYTEKVLHTFTNSGGDGGTPGAGLLMDASGNLYGTTSVGGANGLGTVFELAKSSGAFSEKILHSFANCDGSDPMSGLIADPSGNLYGTTFSGSVTSGNVFELVLPSGKPLATTTTLVSSGNPVMVGNDLTFTVSVTASSTPPLNPTGTVTLFNGSTQIGSGTLQACGGGPVIVDFEDAESIGGIGTATITARYNPDVANFAPSSASVSQTVSESGVVLTSGNNTLTGNQSINGNMGVTGNIAAGSLAIGGGTPIREYISVTDSITLSALGPFSCTRFTTAAVSGFTPGASDTIALGIPKTLVDVPETASSLGSILSYQAWETTTTASPTITIRVCNSSPFNYEGGASGSLRIDIFKH